MKRDTFVGTDRLKRMWREADVLHFVTDIEWTLKPQRKHQSVQPVSGSSFVEKLCMINLELITNM